jgi:hypothetical protein
VREQATPLAADGLTLIASVAGEFGSEAIVAGVGSGPAGGLNILARTPRASGLVNEFRLIAEQQHSGSVDVKEKPRSAQRLPAFCPERHINFDGTFCLLWREGEDIPVRDLASARKWFGTLINFLYAQLYAGRWRTWPRGVGRAHGDAARHEVRAERNAREFGDDMLVDLKAGRIQVHRIWLTNGSYSLRLVRNGERVFAMQQAAARVCNLRRPCPCSRKSGRARPLKKCGSHAEFAADLIRQWVAMEEAERAFWASIPESLQCCGTIDGCPLATRARVPSAASRGVCTRP